jgi:F-type H+-transporting ATPase subunit b
LYTVSVTVTGGGGLHVQLGAVEGGPLPATAEESEELDEGPSPITPESKELLWGLGAFLVFLAIMRLYLFPKVKAGMTARYGKIRQGHEQAEALRADAQREVAEYEQALAAVRAEAATRIEAASNQLEGERSERLAEVNAAIAARRSAAASEAEAVKAAARDTVEAAVSDVAARAAELALGTRPADDLVRRATRDVITAGVAS